MRMVSKLKLYLQSHPFSLGMVIVIVLASGITFVSSLKNGFQDYGSSNLFSLVSGLSVTTDATLAHTKDLSSEVSMVEGQLGQLTAEEALLTKQVHTGHDLQDQLALQESLTENGVSLMRQILEREQKTVGLVLQVGDKAGTLSLEAKKNESVLSHLFGSMKDANAASVSLNQQLTALLNELSISENNFKFFGQIDKLLGTPSGGGTGGASSSSGSGSGLLGSIGSIGSGLLH